MTSSTVATFDMSRWWGGRIFVLAVTDRDHGCRRGRIMNRYCSGMFGQMLAACCAELIVVVVAGTSTTTVVMSMMVVMVIIGGCV